MSVNEEQLNLFLGKMVNELGAAATGALVMLGDRLGLYKAISEAGPLTAAEIANHTGTSERYVREWAACQAASGYINYDGESDRFSMSPEQKLVLSDENSPFLMTGGYFSVASLYADEPRLEAAFRSGSGIAWSDHNACLFCGTAKFFRPGYQANLISAWLPALDGVVEKLKRGAKVADVGCGFGSSTIIMAKAFPESEFIGFDIHEESIRHAREEAEKLKVQNVTFQLGAAKSYPGKGYDLVTFFDCLHDMGDPQGAARHVLSTLNDDGSWMVVEPFANDSLHENLNPVGRVYYAFSTAVCVPASLSQESGAALGAQAGEKRLREVIMGGGFSRFRRATQTPFNLILEARP
ncbi:MAG: methyltransferase domain-containing protein [Deltaproteobacteria bacterium]|nr:methyltransferase domain-containing protein [Deltaproteobacteria bacterium]